MTHCKSLLLEPDNSCLLFTLYSDTGPVMCSEKREGCLAYKEPESENERWLRIENLLWWTVYGGENKQIIMGVDYAIHRKT